MSPSPYDEDRDKAPSLRILLGIESSGPGGAENMVVGLAQGLREVGDKPTIITTCEGWLTARARAASIQVWVMPERPGVDLRWIGRLATLMRREQIDVFHGHEFVMSVLGGAAALLSRTPRIATVHGRHWIAERARRIAAYRVLAGLGMPVVAVSEELAGFLAARVKLPRTSLHVIPNGVEVSESNISNPDPSRRAAARAVLGLATTAPLIVAVGNLYPVKDHVTLLRAIPLIAGAQLAIAGRGEEETRLRTLAAELGITERVHLLGLIDEVPRLLAAADVFVQSSRSEGLPLALLEAMGAGLPVVVTAVGGMVEAVDDQISGLIVPPGDPERLAMSIRFVLDDPDRAAALGTQARQRVRTRYSHAAMTQAYRELYATLAGVQVRGRHLHHRPRE